jgi:hypothetical protein
LDKIPSRPYLFTFIILKIFWYYSDSETDTTRKKETIVNIQQTFIINNPTMNLNNAAVVTPVEVNKNLLNTIFKFQPLSKLKSFLISKTGVEKTYYSLAEVSSNQKLYNFITNFTFLDFDHFKGCHPRGGHV